MFCSVDGQKGSSRAHSRHGVLTDGHRHANKFSLSQRFCNSRDEVAEDDADSHGEEYPHREEAVEPAEPFDGGRFAAAVDPWASMGLIQACIPLDVAVGAMCK